MSKAFRFLNLRRTSQTISLILTILLLGCSNPTNPPEELHRSPTRLTGSPVTLTAEAAAVFGFEDVSKWNGINATSIQHTEGTVSGAVTVTGWMQLTSSAVSTIVPAGTTIGTEAALDILLPESVSWGEIRLIVDLPSQGFWSRDVGGVSLSGIPAGTFTEINFNIPQDVAAALAQSYTDLRFIIVVNAPAMAQPLLFDNLRLAGTSGNSDGGDANESTFAFTLPATVGLTSVVVNASDSMYIADAVHGANTTANLVNMGTGLAEIGADAEVDGNLFAKGNAFLRERAVIHGVVRASGTVDQQNSVVADGGILSNSTIINGADVSWTVNWPAQSGMYNLEPDQSLDLQPGAYESISVKSRAQLTLHAGTYYFNSFSAEPEAQINIIGNGEAVILYIRNDFMSRAQLQHSATSADFFVGFAGTNRVELDGPFAGTVVAPNAVIRLAPLNGGYHEGSFFAKRVEAEARTPLNLVPFAHWDLLISLCPGNPNKDLPGICGCAIPDDDTDGDGYPDCIDLCRDNPEKHLPGITGCDSSDNADCDSDLIPDAVDEWTCDASPTHSATCENAPDGTPCSDGICDGVFECQNGQCGSIEDCKPDCDGECVAYPVFDRTYWVCDCNLNWNDAAALCREENQRKLVSMDTPEEQALVSYLLWRSDIDEAWMGANDLSIEGHWMWPFHSTDNGKLFWLQNSDGTGRNHFAPVIRWADGEPMGGEEEDCGLVTGSLFGDWKDDNCSTARPFVCESMGQTVPRRGIVDHIGIPHFQDADQCDTDYQQQWPPSGPLMGKDLELSAEDYALFEQCAAADTDEYNALGCGASELGGIPSAGDVCPEWDEDIEDSTDDGRIYSYFTTADCQMSHISQSDVMTIEVSDTESFTVPGYCEHNDDCASGYCGKIYTCCADGICDAAETCTPCEEFDKDGCDDSCAGDAVCTGIQACGVPDMDTDNNNELLCFSQLEEVGQPCKQYELCEPIEEINIDTAGFVDAFNSPTDVAGEFPHQPDEVVDPQDTDTAYSSAEFDVPCVGYPATDCNMEDDEHPWCQYNVQAPELDTNQLIDPSTPMNNNSGAGGSNMIDFDFSPIFEWDYATKPGPLGFFEPKLSTHAGVYAGVELNGIFGGSSTVPLVDAQLWIRLGLAPEERLCGLKTTSPDDEPSKIELLGMDFLPESLRDFSYPDEDAQNECVDKYSAFKKAVNIAKKAMRDGQELIRIYNDIRSQNKVIPPEDLCELIIGDKIQQFGNTIPDDIKALSDKYGLGECVGMGTEELINDLITYYETTTIQYIRNAVDNLVAATNALGIEKRINIVNWGDEKEITLFNQTFMVGPIPCNLEVFLSLAYGFDVNAVVTFTPANMLRAIMDAPAGSDASRELSDTIASAGVEASPYAAARVGLFVGVGFDIGFAAAKAGIEGIVSIGEISIPSEAKVGLAFNAVEDTRALTGSLADTSIISSDGAPVFLIQPRKFQLSFVYGMNIGVNITDILSGSVGVKVKLKFLFFSKTWRQKIAQWNGLCSSKVPPSQRDPWCSFNLLSFGEELGVIDLNLPWAQVKMPDAFVQLPRVHYEPNYDDQGNAIPITPVEKGTPEFDAIDDRSGDFLYGVGCSTPGQIF